MGGGLLRVVSGVVAAAFAVAAVLQYNDPDPWRWVLVYGAAAALSGVGAVRAVPGVAALALGAVALAGALWLLPGVVAAAALTGTEEERELTGLLLVTVWMAVLWRASRAQNASAGP